VPPAPIVAGPVFDIGDDSDAVTALRAQLRNYGYGLKPEADYDADTAAVVTAFQRHFRPAKVDGVADPSTAETLARLIAALG
jgi:N-acetylmuramoyl-L-alanine amidase